MAYPYWGYGGGAEGYGLLVREALMGLPGWGVLEGRARELGRCGEVVTARECECCGEVRPGSGTFRGVRRTCGGRSCPYCGWVRAQERVELLRYAALEGVEEVEGYEWQFLTQSLAYDPCRRGEDMQVEGLRSRALILMRMAKRQWEKGLKRPGAALLRCVEVSVRGHVHLHMIYYGPRVSAQWMEEVGKGVTRGKRGCKANSRRIKGGKNGVARATKYAAKSVKGNARAAFNEDVLTGEAQAELLYPELAARWELACHQLRLTETYGALRKLSPPAPEEKGGPHDDKDIQCSCGAVGQYKTVYRRVRPYLMDCHLKGKAGLENNSWLPYWAREAARKKKLRDREKKRLARMKAGR